MNAYAQTPPRLGCLILDVRMPQMSGLELQKILNERGCVLPIIFITAHGTVPTAVRAMQAGAVDFLMKPFDNNALLDRIDRSVERARQEAVHRQQKVDVRDRLALLSTRESEVLALVVEGLTNKQIARKLAISIKTIETHRANIHQSRR
ncbi:MAG: response regulator, partial [Gammaproteobacteria bacterium]|nr:response regulator [Gammaproteobacteria bacterium]